jgi:hypothetical protein
LFVVVFFVIVVLLNYLFSWKTRIELRSLRDRKLRHSRLASISGLLGQASSARSAGQHISPHQAAGCSKDQNQRLGHLRTARADLIELALNRLLGDSLFHDHRIAAIHLRNRLPSRQRLERLACPECLDQCLSLARHFLAEFWLCRS